MRREILAGPTAAERQVQEQLRRASKFFGFLLEIRAELFEEAVQAELSTAYQVPRGQKPRPPALLAMVTLLQSYLGLSDAAAVEAALLHDQRWQMVLGTLGQTQAPFGQGSLVRFRARLLAHDLDQKLVERTVALARQTGQFGWQKLRVALDSSPLWGPGRVEDTWNLLGRALAHVVEAASVVRGVTPEQVCAAAGVTVVGGSSVKAALGIAWDSPAERQHALQDLVAQAQSLRAWVASQLGAVPPPPPLAQALAAVERILAQDLEPRPDGAGVPLRRGVAPDRMPSLGDPEMRHGRKSKAKTFTGYKRHILKLVGTGLLLGGVVRPANEAEQLAMPALLAVAAPFGEVGEVLLDRGYLASPALPALQAQGCRIRCKPWPARNQERFPKDAFTIELSTQQVTCPEGHTVTFPRLGSVVHFPAARCTACPQRARCTTSSRGRSRHIHPQETLLVQLRAD